MKGSRLRFHRANISFDIDDWFSRFVFRWIETIEPKTLTWVDNAISSDKVRIT